MHHHSTLLSQTRKMLAHRWLQWNEDDGAGGYCMLGGIAGALRKREGRLLDVPRLWENSWKLSFYRDELRQDLKFIRKAMWKLYPVKTLRMTFFVAVLGGYWFWGLGQYSNFRAATVAMYNDSYSTSKEEVLQILDLAAEYAMNHEKQEVAKALKQTRHEELVARPADAVDRERINH